MWLVDVKPFNSSIQNMVEIISEGITLLLGYHMVTFAGFNIPYSQRQSVGASAITFTVAMIALHVCRWTKYVFDDATLHCKRWKNRSRI